MQMVDCVIVAALFKACNKHHMEKAQAPDMEESLCPTPQLKGKEVGAREVEKKMVTGTAIPVTGTTIPLRVRMPPLWYGRH